MADYVWELGVDWNAIEGVGIYVPTVADAGSETHKLTSYLPNGFFTQTTPPAVVRPCVQGDDTITFWIFDVTSGGQPAVVDVNSFSITSRAAVEDQEVKNRLTSPSPSPPKRENDPQVSSFFGGTFNCWETKVAVTFPKESEAVEHQGEKFLLTFSVEAKGSDGNLRTFKVDPEMFVGPNGTPSPMPYPSPYPPQGTVEAGESRTSSL